MEDTVKVILIVVVGGGYAFLPAVWLLLRRRIPEGEERDQFRIPDYEENE